MRFLVSILLFFSINASASEPREATYAAAEALLRYITTVSPLADEKFPVCIKLDGVQASATFIERLKNTSLRIVACGSGGVVTRIPIDGPVLGADGNYQVVFGYYIDSDSDSQARGKMMFAFMRQDQRGWHVIRLQGGVSL
jgi:hypothetical protein